MTPAAIIAKWLWTLSYARTRVAQVLQGEGRKPVWQRSKLTPWSSRVVHVELVTSFKMGRFWVKEDSLKILFKNWGQEAWVERG